MQANCRHRDPDSYKNFQDWIGFEVLQRICLWFYLHNSLTLTLVLSRNVKHLILSFSFYEVIGKILIDFSVRACNLWTTVQVEKRNCTTRVRRTQKFIKNKIQTWNFAQNLFIVSLTRLHINLPIFDTCFICKKKIASSLNSAKKSWEWWFSSTQHDKMVRWGGGVVASNSDYWFKIKIFLHRV